MADKPSDWALLTSQIEQIKRIKSIIKYVLVIMCIFIFVGPNSRLKAIMIRAE